jgi:SAM-dependent methyltransferase
MARSGNDSQMGRYWDARAREDALFFIDNRRAYGDPELESFWENGARDLDRLLGAVGASVAGTDVVLDIGCGIGRLTRVLAGRAAEVYGLDVSAEMIQRAKQLNAHLRNVRWLHGDGLSLAAIGDSAVDACVSHVVFQHIPDPQITLGYVREIGRVLRPGGWTAFQVSNDPTVHQPQERSARARIAAVGRQGPRGQRNPAWLGSAVGMTELRAVAEASGLTIERITGEGSQFCVVLARRS